MISFSWRTASANLASSFSGNLGAQFLKASRFFWCYGLPSWFYGNILGAVEHSRAIWIDHAVNA
jgi:hypothetical protein